MKKLLVSTTFILLAFTPFIFGNNNWYQNFGEHKNNSEDDVQKNRQSHLESCKVFEDAILLINDETKPINFHEFPEINMEDWAEFEFVSILDQRPISEQKKILSKPFSFQDFAVFEMKTKIKNGEVTFFNQTGNQAYQQKFSGNEFELKRTDLTAGIYFYKISENGNAINSGKIIIN